jgi:hypothetical protein
MAFSMSNLIEKLNARDKDERYMAMHDLAADLDRDNIKLENEMERRVVNTILKHLEDSSTDVKQQAVRTIAALARKVQEAQLEDIADRLATHIINKTDEEKRDIGSIGLKTLVGVLSQTTAPSVLKRVTPKLQQVLPRGTRHAAGMLRRAPGRRGQGTRQVWRLCVLRGWRLSRPVCLG